MAAFIRIPVQKCYYLLVSQCFVTIEIDAEGNYTDVGVRRPQGEVPTGIELLETYEDLVGVRQHLGIVAKNWHDPITAFIGGIFSQTILETSRVLGHGALPAAADYGTEVWRNTGKIDMRRVAPQDQPKQ